MAEFKSTNTELAAFVVSIYVLCFAVGPLFIAPLSEMYGRVIFIIPATSSSSSLPPLAP
jgi:MFS family permease